MHIYFPWTRLRLNSSPTSSMKQTFLNCIMLQRKGLGKLFNHILLFYSKWSLFAEYWLLLPHQLAHKCTVTWFSNYSLWIDIVNITWGNFLEEKGHVLYFYHSMQYNEGHSSLSVNTTSVPQWQCIKIEALWSLVYQETLLSSLTYNHIFIKTRNEYV